MDGAQRASIEILNELEARPLSSSSGGSVIPFGASTVVWRPGGVSAGNVFATWPEVVAAVATMNGDVTIAVDTDLAPALIPVGAWDLRPPGVSGPVTMVNGSKIDTNAFAIPIVTIDNAAVSIHGWDGIEDIQIDNRSTIDVITTSATDRCDFYMLGFAAIYQSILSGAGASFFHETGAPGGGLHIFMRDFTYIGTIDGGGVAINVTGGGSGTQLNVGDAAIVDTNKISAAAGTINVLVTSTQIGFVGLNPYQPQAAAPTIVPFGLTLRGSAAIVVGTGKTAAIPGFVTNNATILVALKTPVGDANTVKYAALSADRVNGNEGTFQISALSAGGGGATNGADTSTVEYEITTL